MDTRMSRIAVGLTAAVVIGFAGAGTASAQGAAKVPLSTNAVLVNCFEGDAYFHRGSEQVGGFVIFNYDSSVNTVRATVSLKGAAHTKYYVKLVQATPSVVGAIVQCLAVDGTLVTNGRGNGTLTITQPRYVIGNKTARALQVWLSATEYPRHWWDTDELLAANEPYELPALP